MTNQEFRSLTYTTRPKTSTRTTFQVRALFFAVWKWNHDEKHKEDWFTLHSVSAGLNISF